jgi:hypothetical protein
LKTPPILNPDRCLSIETDILTHFALRNNAIRRSIFPYGYRNVTLKSKFIYFFLYLAMQIKISISQPDGTPTSGRTCALSWEFWTIRPSVSQLSSATRSMDATSPNVRAQRKMTNSHFSGKIQGTALQFRKFLTSWFQLLFLPCIRYNN